MQIRTRSLRLRRRAFTLIELMVVTAIMAMIAAVVVPGLLAASDRSRRGGRSASTETFTKPSEREIPRRARDAGEELPDIAEARIAMRLTAGHHRQGMDVFTRFEASYDATFVVAPSSAPVYFDLPFPVGTTEARDVSFRLTAGGRSWEPQGVVYDRRGIFWAGTLTPREKSGTLTPREKAGTRAPREEAAAPGGGVTLHVTFISQGRERFEYRLPASRRLRSLEMELDLRGAEGAAIPDTALQPTSSSSRLLQWSMKSLVTDRPVVLELPGAETPIGRAITLFKLVSLAVLLFGAGFWYLSELKEPGRLDTFRLGHFLLLALNYSLIFAVFAVLVFHGDVGTWPALALSAVLSLPLLVLHVARITDPSFALTRIAPLAVWTLLPVFNGVYGGPWKDYVFIGAAVATIAFVTITYRAFTAGRDARRRGLEEEPPAPLPGAQSCIAGSPEPPPRIAAGPESVHCLRCGAAGSPSPFCPACGTPRAVELRCDACGAILTLPTSLMREDAGKAEIHCLSCGETLKRDDGP